MKNEELSIFLDGRKPIFSDQAVWSKGEIELEINIYRSDEIPPIGLISSVRAIVFRGKEVLTIEEAKDRFHILPGGRREGDESLEDTARREVAEETGWTIRYLKPFAVAHFKHTTPKPKDYPYPYPDFLWLIYTAKAVDFDEGRMFSAEQLVEEYVINSKFVWVRRAEEMVSERDRLLLKAERRIQSPWQTSIDRMRFLKKDYKFELNDAFIDFVEERLPDLWQNRFGDNLFDQGIYGTIQFHDKAIINDSETFKTNALVVLDGYQNHVVQLTYGKGLKDQVEFLEVDKLGSSFEKQSLESLVGDFSRDWLMASRFAYDVIVLMATTLAEQFSETTSIDLNESPFHFNPESTVPKQTDDQLWYIEGDLIGPDNRGSWAAVIWQLKEGAEAPYSKSDLVELPNGRYFSWTRSIQDPFYKERYVEGEGRPTWEIKDLACELSWYKWYDLPDLILQFWTKEPLSEEKLKQAEDLFWSRLMVNMKEVPDRVKELCFHPEVAEQGYAEYFGGFLETAPGHYSLHADLDVCENEIVTCWIRSLDSLHADLGVIKIRVGSN